MLAISRLNDNVTWRGMKKDVCNYVTNCSVCQITKYVPLAPAGLLQPLEFATQVWEDIYMDFMVGLPSYQGNTVIFVVVDRFLKDTHFRHVTNEFTAHKIADAFTSIFCRSHGFPRSIISNRDTIFLSNFWKTLFKLHGTKLRMSSAYHPETDGQIKGCKSLFTTIS